MPERVPVSDSAPSDEILLAEARAGDERAFAAIVDRYEGRVAAAVVSMLGPGDEAEDVGQETFIRLYRYLDRYRGDASLGTYLTRIAMNLSLTALRKRKRWFARFVSVESTPGGEPDDGRVPAGPGLEMLAVDSDDGPLGRLEQKERRHRVHQALADLNPDHRAVVVLRWIDGLSTKEAAVALGIPEGTVMSRLSRAMDRLAVTLKEEYGSSKGDRDAG
jgi:RNA polymerase sigma-70 factor (ECF subfamily)